MEALKILSNCQHASKCLCLDAKVGACMMDVCLCERDTVEVRA